MKYKIFKIKEGKLEIWKEWCHLLSTKHKEEAIETLKEEGLEFESFIIIKAGNDFYTLGMSNVDGKPATARELNRLHKEKKWECLERPTDDVEIGYELEVKNT